MRAITVSEFGSPDVLTITEVEAPEPGAGEVLVRVAGAGVGPWDAKLRAGRFGPQKFPYIPGAELSGVVEAVGDGVAGLSAGDAVFGTGGFTGAYAELSVAPADRLALAPQTIDLADAGAAPIGAGTAIEGIDDHLRLQAGERVLVAGASGGVGSFVVQIAKARGATVVATASPANHDYLRSIGADEVLDYRGDWVAGARGVDAAFDCVGGPTWAQCIVAVRDGGRAVSILPGGTLDGPRDIALSSFSVTVTAARLHEAARLIDAGQVVVEIAARLPLADAAKAHELVETGHTRGKIVLVP